MSTGLIATKTALAANKGDQQGNVSQYRTFSLTCWASTRRAPKGGFHVTITVLASLLALPIASAVTVDRTVTFDPISGPLVGTQFTLDYAFPLTVGPFGFYNQLGAADFLRAELRFDGMTYNAYDAQLITTGGMSPRRCR